MLSFLLEYNRVPDGLEKDKFCLLFYAEFVTCHHPISIFKPFKIQNIRMKKIPLGHDQGGVSSTNKNKHVHYHLC